MKRFEEYVITIIIGIVMIMTSFAGTYQILYNVVDLYEDQATLGTIIATPVIIYWVVKSIIIRLKRK